MCERVGTWQAECEWSPAPPAAAPNETSSRHATSRSGGPASRCARTTAGPRDETLPCSPAPSRSRRHAGPRRLDRAHDGLVGRPSSLGAQRTGSKVLIGRRAKEHRLADFADRFVSCRSLGNFRTDAGGIAGRDGNLRLPHRQLHDDPQPPLPHPEGLSHPPSPPQPPCTRPFALGSS